MEKKIGAFEARRQFGQLIQDVATKGTFYIVERHGQPVAAVVPLRVIEKWRRDRERFFDQLHEIQQRANLSEEEATTLVAEAVAAVRTEEAAYRANENSPMVEAVP